MLDTRANDNVPANRGVKEDRRSSALVPVLREFIADTLTPISAYIALASPGRSCLLESVEGSDRISRYSFIGLDYLETLILDSGAEINSALRTMLARYAPLDAVKLPFSGGVVAVFSYDAARSYERIGPRPPADVAIPDLYAVVPGTWVVFDHFTDKATLIGFARPGEEAHIGERLDGYLARLLSATPSLPRPLRLTEAVSASMDEATFFDRVARAKHSIFEGDAYQLQVGIRFSGTLEGEAFDLYRQLRARNPSPYMFYVDTPFGAILGASPEFLVRLDGQAAQLRPLAGTRSRGATPEEDAAIGKELIANEKERAEHVMLVDLGRNDLGRVCAYGSVHVDELMKIERYSHVMHIVSNVQGELRPEFDALDLFAAAFPAGTVTGTPKIRAMQIIDELESVARGFYAGSVAHLDFDGDMDSCITLRSAHVANGRIYWQASAGIVADSEPQAEYAEIMHKTRIIRDALGLPSSTAQHAQDDEV